MGWGEVGQVGSQRWAKATIQTQRAVLCLQCVAQNDTTHKGGQNWHEEQPNTPYSPINASQDHEMHPRGFTASIKSCLYKQTCQSSLVLNVSG